MNTFENQIEQRQNLLAYYIEKRTEAIINETPTDAWDTLISIVTEQLVFLVSREIEEFFNTDSSRSNTSKYANAEYDAPQETLNDVIRDLGILPIGTSRANTSSDKILVIDMNYLPSEYKNNDLEELRQDLEEEYGCKVLLIDTSRQNTQGNSYSKTPQPVYFI